MKRVVFETGPLDGQNERIRIIVRDTLEEIASFGDGGRQPGQFYGVHSIASDSKGNFYTTETYEGKRVQKFVYKGIGSIPRAVVSSLRPSRRRTWDCSAGLKAVMQIRGFSARTQGLLGLVSPRVGVVRELTRLSRRIDEPCPPVLYHASVSNFDFRKKPTAGCGQGTDRGGSHRGRYWGGRRAVLRLARRASSHPVPINRRRRRCGHRARSMRAVRGGPICSVRISVYTAFKKLSDQLCKSKIGLVISA